MRPSRSVSRSCGSGKRVAAAKVRAPATASTFGSPMSTTPQPKPARQPAREASSTTDGGAEDGRVGSRSSCTACRSPRMPPSSAPSPRSTRPPRPRAVSTTPSIRRAIDESRAGAARAAAAAPTSSDKTQRRMVSRQSRWPIGPLAAGLPAAAPASQCGGLTFSLYRDLRTDCCQGNIMRPRHKLPPSRVSQLFSV